MQIVCWSKLSAENWKNKLSAGPFLKMKWYFKPWHLTADIKFNNYNTVRSDRSKKLKGVLIYYDHNLIADDTATHSYYYCPAAILFVKTLNLIIAGVYRPPSSSQDSVVFVRSSHSKTAWTRLNNLLRNTEIVSFNFRDFNMKFVQWKNRTFKPGLGDRTSEQLCVRIMLSFMQRNLPSQHVKENTRMDKHIL